MRSLKIYCNIDYCSSTNLNAEIMGVYPLAGDGDDSKLLFVLCIWFQSTLCCLASRSWKARSEKTKTGGRSPYWYVVLTSLRKLQPQPPGFRC